MDHQTYNEIIGKLENELATLEIHSHSFIEATEKAIGLCNKVILKFREMVLKNGFSNSSEEIYFFKHVKPKVFSKFILYTEIFNIESNKPDVDKKLQIKYLRDELQKFCKTKKEDRAFYQYYKRGKTFSDHLYFLRGNEGHRIHIDHIPNHVDPEFSTGYDNTLAKIMACEQLKEYVGNKIQKLKGESNFQEECGFISNLHWTNYKVDAVELVYALFYAKVINNGKADIVEIARAFEKMFNIELKNIYHTFKEIQERDEQISFLKHLIETLQKRLDDLEE
ncbi:RteC domain-containing protein [uncultured Draconibacterium sp.]|uniref:RteC domain-containing protein n=1 Tax=uncultured Draconibacterium sp. TaxID=1573823 RepID=UPI0032171B18